MPAENTLVPTLPRSVSKTPIDLPGGVEAHENGLMFAEGLHMPFEQWVSLGQQLKKMHRFTALCVGDWLAYGDFEYRDVQWKKRMPNGVYEQAAKIMGCSEGYLRNLKSACARVNLSCRNDKLTAGHLIEIVSKAQPGQYEFWATKASVDGLSVKVLREALKSGNARHKPEPKDTGMATFIEQARQFARDYASEAEGWSDRYKKEVAAALLPILKDLGGKPLR